MLSENKFNMLLQRVVFDHEILTHRVVARSFKVDTMSAKRLLAEFYERSEGRAHATYILTGFIKAGAPSVLPTIAPEHNGFLTSSNESEANASRPATNGDIEMENAEAVPSSAPLAGTSSQPYVTELKTEEETLAEEFECVMLAPEEEVEAKRTLFSKLLSQEVYSVEPSKLPDLVLLTDANAPVLKDKDLAAVDADVLGTVKHYRQDTKKSGKSSKSGTSASTSNAADGKDKGKSKEASKSTPTTQKTELKRKASNAELDAGKNTSKSASSSKATSPVATMKDKGKEKATTSKNGGPSLDDLFKSDAKQDKQSSSSSSSKPKALSKQSSKQKAVDDEFDDMLADDDDMMAELDDMDKGKSSKPASQSKKQDKPKAEAKEKPTLQSGSRRKTRKVMKKVQEVNAKGYKVTKEVETEEEYTASESDDDGPVVASTSAASTKAAKESKEKEKPKAKTDTVKEKAIEKPKLEKKSSFNKAGSSSSSQAKSKPGPGGQTSLAGFFGKPKPKK